MMKVCCPNCGQAFSEEQALDLKGELSGGVDQTPDKEPAAGYGKTDEEPKSMAEAMGRELDDPAKAKARAARKE